MHSFKSRALKNGITTNASIQALLDDIKKYHNSNLDHYFDQLLEQLRGRTVVGNNTTTTAPSQQQYQGSEESLFSYNGHFHYVPDGFLYPVSATLKSRLEFWFFRMDKVTGKRVCPFRKLKPSGIPTTPLKIH